jgi:hypothetical protein
MPGPFILPLVIAVHRVTGNASPLDDIHRAA